MLSHLISLIDNPARRHVIETLFREARGRKTSQLDREFLRSIGAFRTERPEPRGDAQGNAPALSADSAAFQPRGFPRSASTPALPSDSRGGTPREAYGETPRYSRGETPRETPRETHKETFSQMLRETPEDASSETPSETPTETPTEPPAVLTPREQLRAFRGELASLAKRKAKLVERRKVVTGEALLSGGNGAAEVLRCLDELLSERAQREEWPGIPAERVAAARAALAKQSARELLGLGWVERLGLGEAALAKLRLFLEPFRAREGLAAPSLAALQRAKRDLAALSAADLNWVREAFLAFAREILDRLRALTQDLDQPLPAVNIPAKPAKPAKPASCVAKLPLRSHREPWRAVPAGSFVPHNSEAFFPPMKGVSNPPRGNPARRAKSVPTTPAGSASPLAEGVSTSSSKSPLGRFNMPTLPSAGNVSRAIPAGTWGAKRDLVEETLEQAEKETKKMGGKGKKKSVVLFQY